MLSNAYTIDKRDTQNSEEMEERSDAPRLRKRLLFSVGLPMLLSSLFPKLFGRDITNMDEKQQRSFDMNNYDVWNPDGKQEITFSFIRFITIFVN